MQTIEALSVLGIGLSGDRTILDLTFADEDGRQFRLTIPAAQIDGLFLLLSRADEALKMSANTHKLAHEATKYEFVRDESDGSIVLTLRTLHGFEISFRIEGTHIGHFAETASAAAGISPPIPDGKTH